MITGIDVSANQGRIDWKKVPGNIGYVILRSTTKNHKPDVRFNENAAALNKNSIPYDVYKYVYAKTFDEINVEIFHVIGAILKAGAYGHVKRIWLDVEDCTLPKGTNELSDLIRVGCMAIENNGFSAGVYANYNWMKNGRLTVPKKVPVWVAKYPLSLKEFTSADKPPSFSHVNDVDWTGWQYTSSGRVPGILGDVDMNIFEEDVLEPHYCK